MSGQEEPLLRVSGLSKSFDLPGGASKKVLDDISFELLPGQTLGVVGESGSGKTTLGRCIAGLAGSYEGVVELRGTSLAGLRPRRMREVRRDLQFVFQDPAGALDHRMSILAAVEEPLHIHGIGTPAQRREQAREMLALVGLVGPVIDRKPFGLSGGQLQRAAIARAIVTHPSLVILDEPVSALDVSVRAQVLNLLLELQRELGLGYLFIVHDLAIAEYFSDQLLVLYRGDVVEAGPASEVFANPRHSYTRALLEAIPLPDPPAHTASSDRPTTAGGTP